MLVSFEWFGNSESIALLYVACRENVYVIVKRHVQFKPIDQKDKFFDVWNALADNALQIGFLLHFADVASDCWEDQDPHELEHNGEKFLRLCFCMNVAISNCGRCSRNVVECGCVDV